MKDHSSRNNKQKRVSVFVCTLFITLCIVSCRQKKEDEVTKKQQESDINIGNASVNKQESSTKSINNSDTENTPEEPTAFHNGEENGIDLNDIITIDCAYDYTEDIKTDVDYVVSASASLQEELKNIDKITQKYTLLADSAMTQLEMNMASKWLYVIWDTELNNLWERFSDLADQDTKEKILEEQRNWVAMKDEVTLISIGSREENGSMYPLLVNSLWEDYTKNRAYFIANELAKIEGESFVMPKKSGKYGLFVDNQGTGNVYSFLITKQGLKGEDGAIISVYRQDKIERRFNDNGSCRNYPLWQNTYGRHFWGTMVLAK